MSAVSQIIKSRQRRNHRRGKLVSRRLGQIAILFLMILSLFVSILVIAGSILYANLLEDIPSLESLPLIFESSGKQLHNPTKLYDRSGQHLIAVLENPNARGQTYFSLDEGNQNNIPETLILATIASTDPGYWNNPGVNWDNLRNNNQPTIAQRLNRLYLLEQESPSYRQTFKELILAAQVISLYGHEQILEWYLNAEYYGNLAYGADAAARIYFGKPAAELNLAEAATLAAAAKSPDLNPIDAPVASQEAKDRILQEMFNQGVISAEQLDKSLKQDLSIKSARDFPINLEPAFTNLVIEQASEYIPIERIFRGGLRIITSLDYDLQTQTECTVAIQISRIAGELPEDQAKSVFEECEMARLLPSIYEESAIQDFPIAANALVMDPHEGQILAMVGKRVGSQDPDQFTGHPPGSILSPFIYLTSFTRGTSPATLLWDIPANIPSGFTDIQNMIDQYNGPVSLRTALANDYLVPALQILTQMDPDQVWHTAERLGLTQLQIPSGDGTYRVLFQNGEADLAELSQAYGVLAAQGILAGFPQNNNSYEDPNSPISPQVVLKVFDDAGNERLDCTEQISECRTIKRPVITQELAYLITDVLSDETARWPSLGHPNSLEIGRPAAAKIGSTNSKEDLWTIGYTPDLLAGVWIGSENSFLETDLSPEWSAGLWHAIIQYATRDFPNKDFSVPPSLNEIQVCNPSGLLPTDDCPHVVDEIFIRGNEPTQTDNLYKAFLINQESGRLATIFTSPALIEEEVFIVIPPEAEEWAINAGIPQIPKAYDVLDIELNQTGDARISSPSMFSTIYGSVPIIGRAAGDGFESYRLQIGSGLNPDTWFQIAEQMDDPVQNGQLAMWDTSNLSGLYVLQLLVSYEDERVESSIIQVTIDNQEPEVNIRFPEQEQILNLNDYETITLQAEASDNLEIEKVEFFIDGDLAASLNSPPYAIPWKLMVGQHIIRVHAYDHAGNKSDARVQIIVKR